MRKYNVAVVGATGVVGITMLKVLEEYNFPIKNLYLYASKRSAGKIINFKNNDYIVLELNEDNINTREIDIALFSAGSSISIAFAKHFINQNAYVIDNSSAFRMDESALLIVPEVNSDMLKKDKYLIANPNCSTIQSVVPLKYIHDLFIVEGVNYSTYQAVSGSGIGGINDLNNNTTDCYQYQISNNLIPQIDIFNENGYTFEELKMINETKKILNNYELLVNATCVRVPILNCHSVAMSVKCTKEVDINLLKQTLKNAAGIKLVDDINKNEYPMPINANDQDNILVGRIRKDLNNPKIIHLFCVADNIRKGAASNTIQIAQQLISKNII